MRKTHTETRTVRAAIAASGVAMACLLASPLPAAAEQRFVTIGTGGITGVYYAVGGSICRLVNKDRAKTGIRCSVESTGGSVYNVNTIKAGELDFGMAQSDVQYQAYHGDGQVQAALQGPARGVLGAPGAVHRGRAQGSQHQEVHRLQGQALQRRQPRLGHARGDGGAAHGAAHEDVGLFARLGAEGGRARPGAVRQQDRRLLLRRRPSVGQHPGPDHDLRRAARLAYRSGDRQAGEGAPLLRLRDHSGRPVREQPATDQDLRRAGDAGHLEQGPGRHRVHDHQGGVRQPGRVQEAASRVRAPRPASHGEGRPLGAAA